MIKGIISTGSYIIKLLINIYEKFYKSTAAVREEVYIGVFHRKILHIYKRRDLINGLL